MLSWILVLCCVMQMADCRYLGNRIFHRRYGGPSKQSHFYNSPNLYKARPNSYAYKRPFDYHQMSYYPVSPQVVSYQDRVHQKQKILDLFIDHSGHVDADSLFPHPNDIPTVFIPSNAHALEPARVVVPEWRQPGGPYPPRPGPSPSPPPGGPPFSHHRPPPPPPHAHISMMHPSYETGYNQHHHSELNEVSYAFQQGSEATRFTVPLPPVMKNYLGMSDSYSSVTHNGGSYVQYPQQQASPEHHRPSSLHPITHSSPYAESSNSVLTVHQQHHGEHQQQLSNHLPQYPGHFSHNNPLGTVSCCDNSWNPLQSAPVKEHRVQQPSVSGEHQHVTIEQQQQPMSIFLPLVSHNMDATQAFATVVTVTGNHTNQTSGLSSTDNVTVAIVDPDSNRTVLGIHLQDSPKVISRPSQTTHQGSSATIPKIVQGAGGDQESPPPQTTILMLSPQNSTGQRPRRPQKATRARSSTTVRPLTRVTPPRPSVQVASDPVGTPGSSSQGGSVVSSLSGSPGVNPAGSAVAGSPGSAVAGSPGSAIVASPPSSPAASPAVSQVAAAPPVLQPVAGPPSAPNEVFGIPGDLFPVDPAAADAAGEGGGGNGLVNVFTQFLDELANIIETFSPTELPLADSGVASDPGIGSGIADAGQGLSGAAFEGVNEGAGAIGGAVDGAGAAGSGLTDGASLISGAAGTGVDAATSLGGGVAQGATGGEIPASSQLSATGAFGGGPGAFGGGPGAFGGGPGAFSGGPPPLFPNPGFGFQGEAFQAGVGQSQFLAGAQPQLASAMSQPTPLYLDPLAFPQFAASFVQGGHANPQDSGAAEPEGFPHGGLADPEPFPHGGNADPEPFPHGGLADPEPFPHGGLAAGPEPFPHGGQADPEPFPHGGQADPEPFHVEIPAAEVHHAEGEPLPEANTLVRDHFQEIPISEVTPSPELVRPESHGGPIGRHPQEHSTSDQQYQDYDTNRPYSSRGQSSQESFQNSYSSPLKTGKNLETKDTAAASSSSVTSHQDSSVIGSLDGNSYEFQLQRYTEPHHHSQDDPQALFVTQVPEVISASSAVRHYTRDRNVGQSGGPTNAAQTPEPFRDGQSSGPFRDGQSSEPFNVVPDWLLTSSRNDSILNSYRNLNFDPEPEIRIPGEIGQLPPGLWPSSHQPGLTTTTTTTTTTERPLLFATNSEDETVREYLVSADNSVQEWHRPEAEVQSVNSFDRQEEDGDIVPDAEGIPANILAEVQSNINLDLLKTGK